MYLYINTIYHIHGIIYTLYIYIYTYVLLLLLLFIIIISILVTNIIVIVIIVILIIYIYTWMHDSMNIAQTQEMSKVQIGCSKP